MSDHPPIPEQLDALLERMRTLGEREGLPKFDEAVLAWIHRRFAVERWARLTQAGIDDSEKIPIAKVFVDARRENARDGEPGFVAKALATQTAPLRNPLDRRVEVGDAPGAPRDSMSPEDLSQEAGERRGGERRRDGGFLLVGGPGQGKSTVTQVLCQMHRARWVRHRPEGHAEREEAWQALHDLQRGAGLSVTADVHLPVAFDLPRVGRRVQRSGTSVLDLLAEDLGFAGGVGAALGRVLRELPLLLVLDGLDEVPASGGRGALLARFHELFAALEGATALLVVTTRPQGYGGEFGALREWRIAPWDRGTATTFAVRLLDQRYAGRADRREEVGERIQDAVRDDAVARIMTTPLQVTMMTALVSRLGRVPRERWRLFQEYFRLVVGREVDKGGPVGSILERYSRQVLEIHQHVALLLHTLGEQRDGDACLSRDALREVVSARLERDGVSDRTLIDRVVEACNDRLVFLVQPEQDGIGFEVRSLQEYFAAGALTTGDEELVAQRLEVVARAAYWRNVVVFAVGRVMDDLSPLMQERATVGLCRLLDTPGPDPLDGVAYPGALLALDLLADGAVLAVPRLARAVAEHSLHTLELPTPRSTASVQRLAKVLCDPFTADGAETVEILWRRIDKLLDDKERSIAAWTAAFELGRQRNDLLHIIRARWPLDASARLAILDSVGSIPAWVVELVRQQVGDFEPRDYGRVAWVLLSGGREDAMLSRLLSPQHGRAQGSDSASSFGFYFHAMVDEHSNLSPATKDELWRRPHSRPIHALDCALRERTLDAFAKLVELMAASWDSWRELAGSWGPWIVRRVLSGVTTSQEAYARADALRQGAFGTTETWWTQQAIWAHQGLRSTDYLAWLDGSLTLPQDASIYINRMSERSAQEICEGITLRPIETFDARRRENLLRILGDILSMHPGLLWLITPGHIFVLLEGSTRRLRWLPELRDAAEASEWTDFLDASMSVIHPDARVGPSFAHQFGAWLMERWQSSPRDSFIERRALAFAFLEPSRARSLPSSWLEEVRHTPPEMFSDNSARVFALARHIEAGLVTTDAFLRHWRAGDSPSFDVSKLTDPTPIKAAFATLWADPAERPRLVRERLDTIRALQNLRRSSLAYNGTWARLQLPKPGVTPAPESPAGLDDDVAPPSRIAIKGMRSLDDLALDLQPPADNEGLTLVLLGDNGTGKTTLLRGVAFALVDPTVAGSFPARTRAPFIRAGATSAHCEVVTRGGTFRARIEPGADAERVVVDDPVTSRPFVVAYGCRRNAATSSADGDEMTPAGEIDNLFDRPSGTVSVEDWLARLKAASQKPDDDAWKTWLAARDALVGVLPNVASLDFDARGRLLATLKDEAKTQVEFAALSDGYLTTAGWIADMMARWMSRQRGRLGRAVEPGFCARMSGYLLLDEVDLHLHPLWQTHVLRDVRRLFPRMHLIVTTHNPMTLVGARPGEVRRLLRDPKTGRITANAPTEDPRLRTGSELYKHFFQITDLYPTELARSLRRYHALATDPGRDATDDEAIRELLATLRAEGIEPGFDPVPRRGTA
ncbi:MAG: AAA family ATPase [Polyangiales bacterium]